MTAGSPDNEITARMRSFDGVGLRLQPGDWVSCEGELDGIEGGALHVTAWRTRPLGEAERQRYFMPASRHHIGEAA